MLQQTLCRIDAVTSRVTSIKEDALDCARIVYKIDMHYALAIKHYLTITDY